MNRKQLLFYAMFSLIILLLLAACSSNKQAQRNVVSAQSAGPQGERGVPGPPGKEGKPGKDYTPPPGVGLQMKILSAEIPADQHPVLTVSLTDEKGQAITADTLEGWGFTVAQVEEDTTTKLTRYQNLLVHEVEGKPYQLNGETKQPVLAKTTQAFADTGGAWTQTADGGYTYTFANALTGKVNPDLVVVFGGYAYKNNRQSVANDVYSYVQGGTYSIPEREVVTNAACDLCHNPLQAHGGTRRMVALCVTCHTDQTNDPETGNTLNMKVLVHRLHFGKQLPSVQAGIPFYIVGYKQNVSDFSHDSWPQDLRYCITCHTGGKQSDNYKTHPNTAACTSCHDTTNLTTGENHPGGKQTDAQCAACHVAQGQEFDASVTGAHTIPIESKSISGIGIKILSVEGMKPGSSPVVKFELTVGSGKALDPAKVTSLSVTLAGPTSDYQNRWTEPIVSTSVKDLPALKPNSDGSYQYTFKAAVPTDATGTFAVGMEGYVMETVKPGSDPVRIAAHNPVVYAALDGGDPAPRREVVDIANCNVCHMGLSAHGGNRNNIEYCVMCHNPNASDEARRPAEAMPPTSINFRVMIHKLHKGETATTPLQVYGFGNKLNDFSELIFPGNLQDCQICHVANTYGLPLANGVLPTTITQAGNVVSTTPAVQAVCTSCHDTRETAAHAKLETSTDGIEACLVCHGPGREFDTKKFHK